MPTTRILSNAKTEGIVEDTADWTKEKITIDAGYEGSAWTMYLFLPKNVHPPLSNRAVFSRARGLNLCPIARI